MITDAPELVGPYQYIIDMRRLLQRVGLVIAIAAVAIVCLSSAMSAAVVGIVTAVIVAIDMIAFTRTPPATEAPKINVDLSRRR